MHIPWFFLTVSTLLTFIVLLLLVRWLGSTQLTQLTFFNWVAGASMGNLAANMISSQTVADWASACYTLVIFTLASGIAAILALKSRHLRRVANGEPTVLIHKGIILRENLRKTRVNIDVLMMLLREKGYFSYDEIEFAIMEPTGNLSILPEPEAQSVSKGDMVHGPNLSRRGQGPYIELIIDGEIDQDKLQSLGHDEDWLLAKVHQQGAQSIADVTYLAVNKEGKVISDLFRRRHPHENDLRI
jgi:uncharacterized membrane protein YcaP (DUF421 family)